MESSTFSLNTESLHGGSNPLELIVSMVSAFVTAKLTGAEFEIAEGENPSGHLEFEDKKHIGGGGQIEYAK